MHTNQFVATLKSMHPDVVVYTPLANKNAVSDGHSAKSRLDDILNQLREIRLLSVMFGRRAFGEIRQLIKSKPDVVILRWERYLSAIPLCRLIGVPIVVEINGPALEDRFTPKSQRLRGGRFWQWFEKMLMKLPDHIMVVSDTLKQYYEDCGVSPNKITSVPNGVDIDRFAPEISGHGVREKFGLKDKIIIGFSGNFAPWHGLGFLAEIMNEMAKSDNYENVVFLLIGSPAYNVTMPDMPRKITTITGHVPHSQMPEYLAALDIFVAPYPLIEPFYFSPLKIFEAMAMGKPVIASAQGQICQLITDRESGLLYAPKDRVAFFRNLELLIRDRDLRRDMGRNARLVIEQHYTWQNNAAKMLNLCNHVFASKKRI